MAETRRLSYGVDKQKIKLTNWLPKEVFNLIIKWKVNGR